MGWLTGTSAPEGSDSSDSQSDRSATPSDAVGGKDVADGARLLTRLHEVTSQMAERELRHKDDVQRLQQSENRVTSVERRIRERDAQVTALREEKAGCLRQIEDLKNQLYQLQFEVEETTSDKADAAHQYQAKLAESQRQLADAKRAVDDALQSQVDAVTKATALEEENDSLKRQLQANEGNNQSDNASLQAQLSNLQSKNDGLATQIAEEKANAAKNKQLNAKEIANLRSMLRARDDAIQSLQTRVEKGQDQMTELEAELDSLGIKKNGREEEERRQDEEVGNLLRENEELHRENEELHKIVEDQSRELEDMESLRERNEEMNAIVAEQSRVLEDVKNQWVQEKEDCEEQRSLAERRGEEIVLLKEECEGQRALVEERGEEIELMKSILQEGESEKEAAMLRQNSNHSRATVLEMELQKMNEKVDELSSALNESMEEIEDLQADVVIKEGKITSLEKEIEEASRLLEEARAAADESDSQSRSPPSSPESGKFARLRREIEKVTRERARIEGDRNREIAKLGKELDEVRTQLKAESDNVSTLTKSLAETAAAKAEVSGELEKVRDVMDLLDAEEDRELEEYKANVEKLQTSNDKLRFEIEDLRLTLKEKERELAERDEAAEGELQEAREALIAMDEERQSAARDNSDGKASEELKALNEKLSACKERLRESEAKLHRVTRENETVVSDLRTELASKEEYASELQDELESLQLSVERGPSKRNYGMAIDPEWHEPHTVSKLKAQVSRLTKEKRMVEAESRAKIDARDATIATLVLASSNQEASIAELKEEFGRLQQIVDNHRSSEGASGRSKDVEDSQRREVERLRDRAHDLSLELKQAKRRLSSATEELEHARSQLRTADAMPDAQDLAGRLVISEQAQRMLKAEGAEKLKERDAAIANLLQSIQANEGVISNLRLEVDGFKKKLKESAEERRRLQHESEIFAAQIIDQDEEFEGLNARLREKSGEIASLKREIAASSAEVRNAKDLQTQLQELKDEKRRNLGRINNLEMELREMEMKKAEEDGFEVDRLKLELKNAIADKEATEERLTKQIDSLRKLRNHAVEDFEAKLRDRAGQIASLENELLELREKVLDEDFDDIFLDDKPGQSKKQLLEERDMLLSKNETLGKEIESLRAESLRAESLRAVSGSKQVSELKSKLARSEQLREELENDRSVLSSRQVSEMKSKLARSERLREELEKDRSAFSSSKDKEMDRLHRQLSEEKEAQTIREQEQLSMLKKLESENSDIREEFTIRMKEKNAKIMALEQTLAAQEQVVGNMSSEMDQLQNGMEKVSVQRRAEIEEMSQELMDYTSKATRLEREVMALSMKLDDKKLKHKAEVAKLKDRIATLETETPFERNVRYDNMKHHDKKRENELTEKNDHLKWINKSLKDENEKLKGKVDLLKAKNTKKKEEQDPEPKSAKNNDKWRCVALQEQVAVLSQRVIELEEAASSPTQGRPSQTPRPSILHSPVMRSSLETGPGNSTARSSSAPKSALRVSTYDDANQANHLLSNIEEDVVMNDTRTPPALPRGNDTPKSSSSKSKGSRSASSRFSLRKKGGSRDRSSASPKCDDASGSTANYDF